MRKHKIVVAALKSLIWQLVCYIKQATKHVFRGGVTLPIIKDPTLELEILHHIKDETWEVMYSPEVFNCAKERVIKYLYPAQNIFYSRDSVVSVESDIVITPKGVYWDKYNDTDFITCAIPADANLYSYNRDNVVLTKGKKTIFIPGKTLSMIGVWSYAWCHFIFQFVSKMYFAGEAGILNQKINILTNKPSDANIADIFSIYLKDYPDVSLIYAEPDVDYRCESLIFMPATGNNYDEEQYHLEYRLFAIPGNVINIFDKYLVKPLTDKVRNNTPKHKKIFLSRSSNRTLNETNRLEVEEYFRNKGYFFVEGFELSLEEKADLFYHAEEIVGLHSSAWQNLIFCNGAKCLMICNNRYVTEPLVYTMARQKVKAWINVSGEDNDASRRSNFTIPLEKIINAHNYLLTL